MIISATMNADIPARHGEWFMQRLDAGYCTISRPDGFQHPRIPLNPVLTDGFVFWTRCVAPFMSSLTEIRRRGFAFTVQFAVTGYPMALDPNCIDVHDAVNQMNRLASVFGPRVAVWRYDPVLVTNSTTVEWHRANFERLARSFSGATDEVSIAFARFRRRTKLSPHQHFSFTDPVPEVKRSLVRDFVKIARASGMRVTVCAQPEFLTAGAAPARCIDADRISELGKKANQSPTVGFQPGCLCAEATDIGDSSGVARGLYCGAVSKRQTWPTPGPDDEMLFPARRFARARGDDLPF